MQDAPVEVSDIMSMDVCHTANRIPASAIRRPAVELLAAVLVGMGALALSVAGCGPSDAPRTVVDSAAEASAIRAVLQKQIEAWNTGDLEGFMAGYARTDSLRFASGGTVRTGWDTTLARYRKSYPDRAAMGTLSFERIDIRVLAPRWATVFGAWRLDRAADTPHGLFTLIMEKRDGRWRIVHDHTSSAAP